MEGEKRRKGRGGEEGKVGEGETEKEKKAERGRREK